MSLINFFKKLIEKNRLKESKKETEKVLFDEIDKWIQIKEKEIETKEKEIFIPINNKIPEVINEIKEKIIILKNVDVESIKVEDKIKLIVRENLNNYINYVESFIVELDNLKEEKFERFITTMNKIFSDFDKKSNRSYQKATFIIGKEIADINESIINFSRYLMKISDENKDLTNLSKVISSTRLKLKQMDEIKEGIKEIDKEIKFLDEKIKNNKEVNKGVSEEIEKIKKSKSYIEKLKKQEKIKLEREELQKEIFKLKEMLDFKALGSIFHSNEKKMGVIKDYKKNFQVAFQDDNGASILDLLDEAKLDNKSILIKINRINEMEEKIINNEKTINRDEIKSLLSKTKEIKLEIENSNNEKFKELKKYKKVKIKKEELMELIKQELSKINVIVSDT